MKKKIYSILGLVMVLLLLVSCKEKNITDDSSKNNNGGQTEATETIDVSTTLFPQYDFVRIIGGDKVNAWLLLPPGVEAHSFEPTPRDITSLLSSDLFIFTGESMEPWAENVVSMLKEKNVEILDLSEALDIDELIAHKHDHEHEAEHDEHDEHDHEHEAEHDEHDEHDHEHEAEHDEHDEHEHEAEHDHDDHDHSHDGMDPHFWTDPIIAKEMVNVIVAELTKLDPQNSEYYKANAALLLSKLDELDESFNEVVQHSKSKTIIMGGHNAFAYFAKRYHLEIVSPYPGFSPNAEPTPQRISELIKTVKESNAEGIFYEEFVDPKVAKIISDETGVPLLLLNAAHNISRSYLEQNRSFVDIMNSNVESLKKGLGYVE